MAKEKTYEAAQEELISAKEARKAASEALQEFCKENGLKKNEDHSADEKHGKKWSKLKNAQKEARAKVEAAEEAVKALKPKSERASKYEYPADVVTAEEKKRYRAKMRAKSGKADEEGDKPAKKEKKAKEEEPKKKGKEEKAAKTEEKPKSKKAKVEEDED